MEYSDLRINNKTKDIYGSSYMWVFGYYLCVFVLVVYLMMINGCSITSIDIPTPQGLAHFSNTRMWSSYEASYIKTPEGGVTLDIGTKIDRPDYTKLGAAIGMAMKSVSVLP